MSRIIINDMTFSYKEYYQPVFNKVNLSFDTDWKLGLIGRNGRGKTTLLRLLHGELEPDQGIIMKEVTTELFPYYSNTKYKITMDVVKENIGYLKTMEERMEAILNVQEDEKADVINPEKDGIDHLLKEYQRILFDYMELDGFEMEGRIRKEVNLMKLPETLLEQDYDLLSGGEKTKLQIITLFLRKNAFILLDEPTNHLDLDGKQVLAEYLKNKKGFLVVSHDRKFLDDVIDHVLSINKCNIAIEKGNFSSWKKNKEMTEEYEMRTKEKLEGEIEALEKLSVRTRNWASIANKEKVPYATNQRANGARAFMRQAKTAEKNIQDNIVEKKSLLKNYEISSELILMQQDTKPTCLISAYNLSFGYTEKPLFEKLTFYINKGDRIWIRGCNGAGKSTLLKILGRKIPSSRIQFADNLNIVTAFQDPLWTSGYITDLITDPQIRGLFLDICHRLDLKHDVLVRPIETFSSGEQKKIDIVRALAMPNQLLLLDEPLNFMDICFREQLEKAILTYHPTIVFVEHDELFASRIATGEIVL